MPVKLRTFRLVAVLGAAVATESSRPKTRQRGQEYHKYQRNPRLGRSTSANDLRLGPSRWQRISTWMVSRARRTPPYYNEAAGRADRCSRLGFLRCDLPT